jgi:hypothetical protein
MRKIITLQLFFDSIADARNVFLPDFTEDCVACICDASSACNLTIGCFAGLCGPFLIGRQYWLDAGAPVLPGATWQSKNGKEGDAAVEAVLGHLPLFSPVFWNLSVRK